MTGPLVTVAQLRGLLDDPQLHVVDCRFALGDPDAGRQAYLEAHIPGAVYLSLDADMSSFPGPGRHPLPTPVDFATTLGALGIGNDARIVAYDDAGGGIASRLWWMLRSLGHDEVALLDGGWPAWLAAGMPTGNEPPLRTPEVFVAPHDWAGVIDGTELERRLGQVMLVDARAPERYRGETEPLDPVAGHIPSAVNLPFGDNLDAEGRFRSTAELGERFSGLGGDIVAYCGSGVTACHDILAMELAGITGVTLYPGSWSDWSTAGGEVAVGADPGEPTR